MSSYAAELTCQSPGIVERPRKRVSSVFGLTWAGLVPGAAALPGVLVDLVSVACHGGDAGGEAGVLGR